MADMNMEVMMKDDPEMDMSDMDMETGWDKAGTPPGHKALSYADLRYKGIQRDTRKPEVTLRLGGNMEEVHLDDKRQEVHGRQAYAEIWRARAAEFHQ